MPRVALPATLAPERKFGIVLRKFPSADDQVRVWAEDEDFGLEESWLEQTIDRVRHIGFEFGMLVLSRLAALIGRGPSSVEQQLRAVDQFFIHRQDKLAASQILLQRGRLIFCEQHINRLARLLVLHAPDRPIGEPSHEELWLIQRTMIGMGSLVEHRIQTCSNSHAT